MAWSAGSGTMTSSEGQDKALLDRALDAAVHSVSQ